MHELLAWRLCTDMNDYHHFNHPELLVERFERLAKRAETAIRIAGNMAVATLEAAREQKKILDRLHKVADMYDEDFDELYERVEQIMEVSDCDIEYAIYLIERDLQDDSFARPTE